MIVNQKRSGDTAGLKIGRKLLNQSSGRSVGGMLGQVCEIAWREEAVAAHYIGHFPAYRIHNIAIPPDRPHLGDSSSIEPAAKGGVGRDGNDGKRPGRCPVGAGHDGTETVIADLIGNPRCPVGAGHDGGSAGHDGGSAGRDKGGENLLQLLLVRAH